MGWKSLIPLYGKMTVRKKIGEIEDKAGSLPIIFGVLFTKVIEQLVLSNFMTALKFFMAAMLVAVTYIYRHEAKEKAKEVKENVSEE